MHDQTKPLFRWRRYVRFRVRALVLVVPLIGLWLACLVRSARFQHDAVAAIRMAHGRVWYEWQYREGMSSTSWVGDPTAPRWLVDRPGVDFFGSVVAVNWHAGWGNRS